MKLGIFYSASGIVIALKISNLSKVSSGVNILDAFVDPSNTLYCYSPQAFSIKSECSTRKMDSCGDSILSNGFLRSTFFSGFINDEMHSDVVETDDIVIDEPHRIGKLCKVGFPVCSQGFLSHFADDGIQCESECEDKSGFSIFKLLMSDGAPKGLSKEFYFDEKTPPGSVCIDEKKERKIYTIRKKKNSKGFESRNVSPPQSHSSYLETEIFNETADLSMFNNIKSSLSFISLSSTSYSMEKKDEVQSERALMLNIHNSFNTKIRASILSNIDNMENRYLFTQMGASTRSHSGNNCNTSNPFRDKLSVCVDTDGSCDDEITVNGVKHAIGNLRNPLTAEKVLPLLSNTLGSQVSEKAVMCRLGLPLCPPRTDLIPKEIKAWISELQKNSMIPSHSTETGFYCEGGCDENSFDIMTIGSNSEKYLFMTTDIGSECANGKFRNIARIIPSDLINTFTANVISELKVENGEPGRI